MNKLTRFRDRARELSARLSWLPPLLLRLTLGVTFVGTGWGKIHSLDRVTAFFGDLGIPLPHFNAVLVSLTELVGGALLVVGLGTRLAALPLACTMVVAIATAKWSELHGLVDLAGTIELTYLVMFLTLALTGPGKVSLDAVAIKFPDFQQSKRIERVA